MEESAKTIKKLYLELGGNASVLLSEKCNLELVVQEIVETKFKNSGQTCISANRIYVQSSIYEDFLKLLSSKVTSLKLGVLVQT